MSTPAQGSVWEINFAARAAHLLREPKAQQERDWMRSTAAQEDSRWAGPAAALVAHCFLEELDRDGAAEFVDRALSQNFYSAGLVRPYAGRYESSDPVWSRFPHLAAAASNFAGTDEQRRDPLALARLIVANESDPREGVLAVLRPSPFRGVAPGIDPDELWAWLTAGRYDALPAEQIERARERMVEIAGMEAELRGVVDRFRDTAEGEQARIDQILGALSARAQGAAAGTLIEAYAKSASDAAKRALLWTVAAVATVVLALCAAVVFLLVSEDASTSESIARSSVTVLLIGLAGYFGRIASHERRDGRSWTHMELQIATSQAYVQGLPDAERAEVSRTLAMGFFPGQSQDPHGEAKADNVDLPSLLQIVSAAQGSSGTKVGGAKNEQGS